MTTKTQYTTPQDLYAAYYHGDVAQRREASNVAAKVYANALRQSDSNLHDWISLNNGVLDEMQKIASNPATTLDSYSATVNASKDVFSSVQKVASIFQNPDATLNAVRSGVQALEYGITHVDEVSDKLLNGASAATNTLARAVLPEAGVNWSRDERLRLAEIYDLPYEQRLIAIHGEQIKGALELGATAKVLMSLPSLNLGHKIYQAEEAAKKGLDMVKSAADQAVDNLPVLQDPNGLVPLGASATNGLTPAGMAMASMPRFFPKGVTDVTNIREKRVERNLESGLQIWAAAKKEMLFETYIDLRSAKSLLKEMPGMSIHEIRNNFNREAYQQTDSKYETLFYNWQSAGYKPIPDNVDVAALASEYLSTYIKAKQNEIAYQIIESAKPAFPEALGYRSANSLPLPDPTLHPREYQAAGKFYTEIANSMFRAELRINRDDAVARIPINEYLPNEPFAKTIIVVDKTRGGREVYFVENEFEIVGNFNNSPTPTKNNAYSRISETQAIMLADHLIETAVEKDVRNASNPHYESELPFTLKMAEKLHSVIKPEEISTDGGKPLEP